MRQAMHFPSRGSITRIIVFTDRCICTDGQCHDRLTDIERHHRQQSAASKSSHQNKRLLGRKRLIVRGRYDSVESVLSWMEAGRTEGFFGVLQGLSGAPVLDSNGRVIGVFSVETRDQGRIISVAPENLKDFLPASSGVRPEPIIKYKFSRHADNYRRDQRIVEVRCEMR